MKKEMKKLMRWCNLAKAALANQIEITRGLEKAFRRPDVEKKLKK